MLRTSSAALLAVCTVGAQAGERQHPEAWYVQRDCTGVIEYRLPDDSRVDCLTDTHAVEYDFADKADEAVGQSLRYAAATGKLPGIVLIVERAEQERYVWRLFNTLIDQRVWIRVEVIRP